MQGNFFFLLKHTFQAKTLHQVVTKKQLLCFEINDNPNIFILLRLSYHNFLIHPILFALNVLKGFLNYRFFTAQEKQAATLKFTTGRLFWKFSRMAESLFSSRVSACRSTTFLKTYPFTNVFQNILWNLQNSLQRLH